jgi:hypothetical protein
LNHPRIEKKVYLAVEHGQSCGCEGRVGIKEAGEVLDLVGDEAENVAEERDGGFEEGGFSGGVRWGEKGGQKEEEGDGEEEEVLGGGEGCEDRKVAKEGGRQREGGVGRHGGGGGGR